MVVSGQPADSPLVRLVAGDDPDKVMRIAGDVLFPGTGDGAEAIGFLAAGPRDAIGRLEVPESKPQPVPLHHLDVRRGREGRRPARTEGRVRI